MTIQDPIPRIESILGAWRQALGDDFQGYRNHVYRMAHFCLALCDAEPTIEGEYRAEATEKIFIAAAFHDLGIWSASTVDYLPPSVALARDYLAHEGLTAWSDEVAEMIDLHHKLRRVGTGPASLVESFRRGDLVDFSLGAIKHGLSPALVRQVKTHFPNAGFHRRLMQLAGGWFRHHPLSPPPFLKW